MTVHYALQKIKILLFMEIIRNTKEGIIGWTLPVKPYGSETQMPGPNKPVTWKAPKEKQSKPDKNKWIPKILGKSKAGSPVRGSRNNCKSQ